MFALLKNNKKAAFTLVEMLVYIAILVVITIVTMHAVMKYSKLISNTQARTQLVEVAHGSLERLVREVRNADSVNTFQSDLEKATSTLSLIAEDYTTVITGTSTSLMIARNGGLELPLTSEDVSLEAFYVYHYTTLNTEAVRFVVTLSASSTSGTIEETFEAFSTLRGSYE